MEWRMWCRVIMGLNTVRRRVGGGRRRMRLRGVRRGLGGLKGCYLVRGVFRVGLGGDKMFKGLDGIRRGYRNQSDYGLDE